MSQYNLFQTLLLGSSHASNQALFLGFWNIQMVIAIFEWMNKLTELLDVVEFNSCFMKRNLL